MTLLTSLMPRGLGTRTFRSWSAAAINKSEMRLSISKIKDVETGDEDDIKEDGENGEEELGLEIRKAMLDVQAILTCQF